ncbi:Sulfhydryl oxidase 1 [Asimina triloba]
MRIVAFGLRQISYKHFFLLRQGGQGQPAGRQSKRAERVSSQRLLSFLLSLFSVLMSSSTLPLLFFLPVLFLLCFGAPSSSLPDVGVVRDPPRSQFRAINDPDAATDLSAANFDVVLRESPASFAVVEFFAHWLVCWIPLHAPLHDLFEFRHHE